jgi:DNA sulfur modification protein DndD
MLFLKLTVHNFGVFKGTQTFELAPCFQDGQRRHLTIFSGHNGAGKTTIFQALMLALHGSANFEGSTDLTYPNFILGRMHHSPTEVKPSTDVHSGVALSLRYVQSGQHFDVGIERRWQKQGHTIKEDLNVLKNGQPIDVNPDDYQTWIDDIVSPGIGLLCFFNAEKLDDLASEDQQSKVLSETLHRLLGLDLVQNLETDLDQFTTRQGSTKKIEALYTKVLEVQADRDKLEYQISLLQKELDEVKSDIASCESALTQQERRLATEGGAYAARRPVLTSQLQTIQKEIEVLSNQLHELCTDLLPFALTPELCLQLLKRLAAEIEIRQRQMLGHLFEEKLPQIEELLAENDIWEELGLAPNSRRHVAKKLAEKLKSFGGLHLSGEGYILHHLSEPQQQQLNRWIYQVIHDVPRQTQQLGERLRVLKGERQQIEINLQRAPDDTALAPIHEEIQRLQGILASKQKRQAALNEQIGALQFQRDEKKKQLQEVIDQYVKVRKNEKQLKYAEQTRNVLRTYKDALVRQKLRTLEESITACFNKICHKEHLLSGVQIDPVSLSIQLKSIGGSILNLRDFSAGERQLYAMSLLWALRLVSNLPLPLAIDTPLARLDETHRLRLIHDYLPQVSDQVLLFATDAEIDSDLLVEAKAETARVYRLNYDAMLGETKVSCESDSTARGRFLTVLS